MSEAIHSLCKIVIAGSGGVGKSALTIQFLRGMFVSDYDPTIEESYRRDMVINSASWTIEFQDTAGQEEYIHMNHKYFRNGDGFAIIYSIDDERSLLEIEKIALQIKRLKEGRMPPATLVGNKSDLTNYRQVTEEAGQNLAKELKMKFLETSAKTKEGVDEMFMGVIRRAIKYLGTNVNKRSRRRYANENTKRCTLL